MKVEERKLENLIYSLSVSTQALGSARLSAKNKKGLTNLIDTIINNLSKEISK